MEDDPSTGGDSMDSDVDSRPMHSLHEDDSVYGLFTSYLTVLAHISCVPCIFVEVGEGFASPENRHPSITEGLYLLSELKSASSIFFSNNKCSWAFTTSTHTKARE
jgi:hypothetical protein